MTVWMKNELTIALQAIYEETSDSKFQGTDLTKYSVSAITLIKHLLTMTLSK